MALVAPLAGARIEIVMKYLTEKDRYVAPLAGARIEIYSYTVRSNKNRVAPLAGARIEIPVRLTISDHIVSLPSRERGLKS